MKYPIIAILGVVILALATAMWVAEASSAWVVTLFILGLAITVTGVILFNNSRIKRIRENGKI